MKPGERRNLTGFQPRPDDNDGRATCISQEADAWFYKPHCMTQEEEQSFLRYMSNETDSDRDQRPSNPDPDGNFFFSLNHLLLF